MLNAPILAELRRRLRGRVHALEVLLLLIPLIAVVFLLSGWPLDSLFLVALMLVIAEVWSWWELRARARKTRMPEQPSATRGDRSISLAVSPAAADPRPETQATATPPVAAPTEFPAEQAAAPAAVGKAPAVASGLDDFEPGAN